VAINPILIGPLFETISSIVKRVLPPEKISEVERLKLEQALQMAVLNQSATEFTAEMSDRASARSLGQADVEKGSALTNVLAALHRPMWSFVMLAIYVITIIDKWLGIPDLVLDPVQESIMRTVIIFYFGGRTIEKATAIAKNGVANGIAAPKAPAPRAPAPAPVTRAPAPAVPDSPYITPRRQEELERDRRRDD